MGEAPIIQMPLRFSSVTPAPPLPILDRAQPLNVGEERSIIPHGLRPSRDNLSTMSDGRLGSVGAGPLELPRLVVFPFVEQFIEESMRAGRGGGTTGLMGETYRWWYAVSRSSLFDQCSPCSPSRGRFPSDDL